jgi:tripartite-type tricarboxylate transporter receptor subunit TctC
MRSSVRLVASALLAGALVLPIGLAVGQTYPSKPIRFIVPLSAGAGDTLTRTIGQKISESWNQPVVVENRPGAGSTIGSDIVAKAAPDGYTLLMASFSHAVNPTLYAKLPYDTLKDFAAVTLIGSAPNVLTVNPGVSAKSVAEVMALAKSQPGKLHFASAGNGSSSHMAGELFKNLTGAQIVHVPYKGAAPAMTDLLAGQVQMAFDPLPSSLANIKAGKLRAVAVTSAKRSPALPDVPAIGEIVPGYELAVWYGVVAPANTPKDIIGRLHAEIVRVLNLPDVKERVAGLGFETVGGTPDQFQAFIEAEVAKWGKVVREAGLQPN